MSAELAAKEKVVGLKQTKKAIAAGKTAVVSLAKDADPKLTEPLRAMCRLSDIEVANDRMRDQDVISMVFHSDIEKLRQTTSHPLRATSHVAQTIVQKLSATEEQVTLLRHKEHVAIAQRQQHKPAEHKQREVDKIWIVGCLHRHRLRK